MMLTQQCPLAKEFLACRCPYSNPRLNTVRIFALFDSDAMIFQGLTCFTITLICNSGGFFEFVTSNSG